MDKNYLVTKSNYFIMNSSYDLSLEEQKIILTLASMVQPTDEEFKPYNFKIADFMKLLGVDTKTKYTEIPKITKELMKKVFEIEEGNTIIQTAWLSGVRYERGSGMVTLKFNPDLKPYLIKLNNVFTQYKLTNILSMRSKYSIRMYEILKANEFKKQKCMDILVEELRKLLKADKVYPLYNDFKRFVIERTQKELKKLSDINFEFEEIKTGRKVTSLRFYINLNKSKTTKECITLLPIAADEVCAEIEGKYTNNEEKCSTELINMVKSVFKENIKEKEAEFILNIANGDINIIKEKYDIVSKMKRVDSVVATMIDAIRKDYQAPIGKEKVDSFNDYEQRSYDFTDLERKLLGWDKKETNKEGEEFQQLSIK